MKNVKIVDEEKMRKIISEIVEGCKENEKK